MDINNSPININISTKTIFKVVLVFLLLYFFYLIKDVLIILFVSLVLASAVDPMVDWMQGKKIPRSIGILIIYLIFFLVFSLAIYLIIPPIAAEIKGLADNFPRILDKVISSLQTFKQYSVDHGFLNSIRENLGSVSSNLQRAAVSVFSTISSIFGGVMSFFLVIVLTFYMVVEENAIKKLIFSIAPAQHQTYVMNLMNRMQRKMGMWLRGQVILCFSVFILVYAGLSILGVKYALVLALIAGITEAIPYVGPTLAAIPAIFLAFTQAPILALFTGILYYIVQLTENNLLVPKVMQKTVGLNPIISIAALLIGFNLAGIVGAILSIPVATAVSVFVKDIFNSKEAAELGKDK
jgi:predicted PurR-regulated permease PerM